MSNELNRTRILLVDDQSIILDGIGAILAQSPIMEVVGCASNGVQALQRARELKPELVVMDINMPGMDGVEATRKLLRASPGTKVLVLSMYGHSEFVRELMGVGVRGYLLKTTGKDELLHALSVVSKGDTYIARELRAVMESADRFKDRSGETIYGALTKREVEIVRLIIGERTSQEIADALFISTPTVETHRRNILHKLDVRNTAGLVKYAMQRGWDLNGR